MGGRIFVISGPSGVGKGTLVRRLLEKVPDISYSVSCTTRHPRPGEIDGRDYRFVSPVEFDRLVERGAFLEWARIFGHRSGTLWDPIEEALSAGRDVVLEIDVQGAAQVRERVPSAVLVFLAAPSEEELARRLRLRGTESGPQLEARLARAREETSRSGGFDHVVVNDDLDRAAAEVAAIIAARRGDGSHDASPVPLDPGDP